MKTVLDTTFIIPGALLLTTETIDPTLISPLIRAAEEIPDHGIVGAAEGFVSPNVPSHTRIVLIHNDLIGASEMTWPQNHRIVDTIADDLGGKLGNHICKLIVPPMLINDYDLQDWANEWQLKAHKVYKEYGIENLFAYIGLCPGAPKEPDCSMYGLAWLLALAEKLGATYPKTFPEKWLDKNGDPARVSPEDLGEWGCGIGWEKPFTKQVPDDYTPNQEVLE
jgi:hypothetical protein